MVHPDEESGGASVEIQPDVVHVIAGQVSKVKDMVAKATTSGGPSVSAATTTGAAGMKGWSSAETLSQVLEQWSRKSRALTEGVGGLEDFSSALKGLVTEAVGADGANAKFIADAGAIDKTMESFHEPYEPASVTTGQVKWVNDRVGDLVDGLNPFPA